MCVFEEECKIEKKKKKSEEKVRQKQQNTKTHPLQQEKQDIMLLD